MCHVEKRVPGILVILVLCAFDVGHSLQTFGIDGAVAEQYAIGQNNCTFVYTGE